MKLQVNVKIPDEELAMLKALAKGELASDCPTCGKPWDLSNLATKDPIPFSRLASKFLIEKIRDEFHKAQFKGGEL